MASFFASTDWAVVWATLVGPVAAVVISVWIERNGRQQNRRLDVIDGLIQGKAISNRQWNLSLLKVPLEFRHKETVMARWEDCAQAALEKRMTGQLMDDLILAALKAVGVKERPAGQVVRWAYRTDGVVKEDERHENALEAIPRLADALQRSAAASEAMLALLRDTRPGGEPA